MNDAERAVREVYPTAWAELRQMLFYGPPCDVKSWWEVNYGDGLKAHGLTLDEAWAAAAAQLKTE